MYCLFVVVVFLFVCLFVCFFFGGGVVNFLVIMMSRLVFILH